MPPLIPRPIASLVALAALIVAVPAAADDERACEPTFDGRVIASIAFTGLEQTRPFVVRRELAHHVGTTFSCAVWDEERRRLESLDVFARVWLDAAPEGHGLALTYHFLELPRFVVFPAVKRSDTYGWLLGPGVATMNLFGRDIRVEAFLRTLLFPDPFAATEFLVRTNSMWIGDWPIEYEISLARGDAFNDIKGFDENYWDGSLDLFHRLGAHLRIGYHASLFYMAPDPAHPVFMAPGDPAPLPMLAGGEGGDLVPGLGIGVAWDSRSSRFNPYHGVYQELRISRFGDFLGGDASYSQILVDHRSFWSHAFLRGRPTILHLSLFGRYRPGRMGAYDYFSVGGPNTLRGHALTRELYGQHELLTTAELRQEVVPRTPFSLLGLNMFLGLQLVAGVDGVLLWRPHDPLGDARPHGAIYFGAHLLLPALDRVRIELGMHPGPTGWQLGFSLGLYEKSYVQRMRLR